MRAKEFFIRAGKLLSAVLFLSVGLSMISQARGIAFKIPVELEVKGNAPEETYTFTMERDSEYSSVPVAPVASPSEISVTGSGAKKYNLEFNEITYNQAGTYVYLVKQTQGNKSYFTYDSSVYRVIVKVEDDRTKPAGLTCVYWAGKLNETDKTGRISFVNSYSRGTNPPGGGGDTPPGGGGDTPPGGTTPPGGNTPPNPTQPTPKIPEVQGEVRPFDPVKAIQKVPEVFGAIRKVATGDSSSMALYGLFAATSMCSLFFWGIGQKKKEKKA
jgi:hypothetical protein